MKGEVSFITGLLTACMCQITLPYTCALTYIGYQNGVYAGSFYPNRTEAENLLIYQGKTVKFIENKNSLTFRADSTVKVVPAPLHWLLYQTMSLLFLITAPLTTKR